MEEDKRKKHNLPHSGRKADKKKTKAKKEQQNLTARQRNPKAFAINSVNKAAARFRHAQDLDTRKQHQPKVDRTPVEPPPYVVALIGPPGVGKSTLLRSLIKHYTGQKVSSIHGPITVVSSKKCRLTFIEVNCDINSLIDIAKVVDLALLFIHGKHGLDLETMEFLTICREVGMPKVLAVLTHLDTLPHKAAVKKAKDTIKKRYGMEIQKGAKIFYFSRFNQGEYPHIEVRNLARFVANIKVRPIQWRIAHPYMIVDRMEDITDPKQIRANKNCNRKISLYGYLRGSFMKKGHSVHIAGVGDHTISEIDFVPEDPCPLPDVIKKRSLTLKERNIYSHWSGLGGIMYDKDGVYIHKTHQDHKSRRSFSFMFKLNEDEEDQENEEVSGDEALEDGEQDNEEVSEAEDIDDEQENESGDEDLDELEDEDLENELESEEEEESENEDNISDVDAVSENEETENLDNEFINDDTSEEDLDDSDDQNQLDLLTKRKHLEDSDDQSDDAEMPSKKQHVESDEEEDLIQHDDAKNIALIKEEIDKNRKAQKKMAIEEDIFVKNSSGGKPVVDCLTRVAETEVDLTGLWVSEDLIVEANDTQEHQKDSDNSENDDSENDEEEEKEDSEEEKSGGEENEDKEAQKKKKLEEKKLKTKREFDMFIDSKNTYYDELKEQMNEQAQLNKSTFEGLPDRERVEYEGYRPGMYLRIVVEDMPVEFVEHFDPDYPLIVGGLKAEESIMTYLNLKIKSHRWYCRILKSDDPLILSMGWRRFQTIPVFYGLDDNGRQRRRKYTHKYVHCNAVVWAPYTPTGTGIVGLQSVKGRDGKFRIAATAEVIGSTETPNVVKKLKLKGYPRRIFKKTAFIEKMFTSELEVAKFEGALLKTQSGIRGIIKKAVKSFEKEVYPEGTIRATFEDMILKSDIVFMSSWVKIDIQQFYYPVLSLLLKDKTSWEGMKTVGRLRFERGLTAPLNQDSLYTPVEHKQKVYPEIRLHKDLQRQLPYKSKPKFKSREKTNSVQRVAVIKDKHEQDVSQLMKQLRTVSNEKARQEIMTRRESIKKHKKKMRLEAALKKQKEKDEKKKAMWRMRHKKN